MPSKLDYLSKYTSKETKKSSKKKSKKEKKRDDYDLLPELPPTRGEHDDGGEEDEGGEDDGPVVVEAVTSNGVNGSSPTRSFQRHDTSSEEEEDKRPRRRRRHDSPLSPSGEHSSQENGKRPKRHDSSDSDDNPPPASKRHDSSDGSDNASPEKQKGRQRHDSSDEEEGDRKRVLVSKHQRHESSSSSENDGNGTARMSSGHAAGLQKGREFARKEAEIQNQRREEAQEMVDKYGIGETVYRKRANDDKANKKKKHLTDEEKLLLHTGRAQLEQAALAEQEFQKIKESSFARRSDDTELEDLRKNEIRPDDPMAAYAMRQQQKTSTNASGSSTMTITRRPVYKGPPPKPNRFGIPPGHRWDAVDRGNGFEDRLLAKRSISQHQREREYRNSAADM